MKYTITRQFFETYVITSDTLEEAIKIMDDCNTDPIEIIYGDITEIQEE